MVVIVALVLPIVGWRLLGGSAGRGPVDLSRHPEPATSAAASCRRFEAALPDRLGRLDRRQITTERVGWAAYGDPAVEIRCGVAASSSFQPGDQLLAVNDVAWYADESRPGGVDFSLPRSIVNVSVWIPAAYRAELLSLLTDAVKQAQPL